MNSTQIHAQIDAAVSNGGGTSQMSEYLKHIMSAESGGNRFAKNTRSSATGLFQFIDSTWNACGGGDRFDVATQCRNVVTLAKQNEAALMKVLGREPTAGEYYLAHFAGAAGAKAVLEAAPGTALSDIPAMRSALGSNPHIKGMTAGNLRAWTTKKMGGALSFTGGDDLEEERAARAGFVQNNEGFRDFLHGFGLNDESIGKMDVMSQFFAVLFMSFMDKAMAEKGQSKTQSPDIASANQNTVAAPSVPSAKPAPHRAAVAAHA